MEEIVLAGAAVKAVAAAVGRPIDKLNVGQLGNITPQLHVHVIGRRPDDAAWPGPVWGCRPARALHHRRPRPRHRRGPGAARRHAQRVLTDRLPQDSLLPAGERGASRRALRTRRSPGLPSGCMRSTIRPSTDSTPAFGSRSNAAMTARAQAMRSAEGEKARLAVSICEGWIRLLPSKPSSAGVAALDLQSAGVLEVVERPVERRQAPGPGGDHHLAQGRDQGVAVHARMATHLGGEVVGPHQQARQPPWSLAAPAMSGMRISAMQLSIMAHRRMSWPMPRVTACSGSGVDTLGSTTTSGCACTTAFRSAWPPGRVEPVDAQGHGLAGKAAADGGHGGGAGLVLGGGPHRSPRDPRSPRRPEAPRPFPAPGRWSPARRAGFAEVRSSPGRLWTSRNSLGSLRSLGGRLTHDHAFRRRRPATSLAAS